MSIDWLLILIILLCVSLIGLVMWLVAIGPSRDGARDGGRHRAAKRPHRNDFRPDELVEAPPRKRAAIIINPTKFEDPEAVQRQLSEVSERLDWDEPLFLTTTAEDPGTGQAREALAAGVDVVCPLGGDGTIRAVATALIGSETPLGLIPKGTGNLLARNLQVPFDKVEKALEVAYTGKNRRIDVGWARLDPESERLDTDPAVGVAGTDASAEEGDDKHIFLVMAGLGFDAAIMSGTTESAKARVGWGAYVATGLRNLGGPSFKAKVRLDLEPELSRRTRSVLIGNCGRLQGGIQLMPDAKIDDGVLDCVILSPKGIMGWGAVAAQVATKRGKPHERLERHTGRAVEVRTDSPEEIQLDGDIIGSATHVVAWVEPHALIVRVEATTEAV